MMCTNAKSSIEIVFGSGTAGSLVGGGGGGGGGGRGVMVTGMWEKRGKKIVVCETRGAKNSGMWGKGAKIIKNSGM